MPTVEETINTLKDMGFSEERAKKALNKTGWQGVEQAMEWLLAHPEGEDGESSEDEEMLESSPSNQPAKVLTPEEKAEKLKELEVLRVKKRKEREEREKKEALVREKQRIEDGKKMTEIKQDMADKEIIRMAEERKREKLETLAAREKVKAQIQADRERKKREMLARTGQAPPPVVHAAAVPIPAAKSVTDKNYDETKLQIRLTNGKALVQSFKAKEPLSAVRLYIQLNRDDTPTSSLPVKLMTNFPKKVFEEEDYEKPLDILGLCPSAVLIVMK